MRYVAGLMMVAFSLVGLGLFAAGVRGLIRRFTIRRHLRPAEGEIVRIEKRVESTDTDSGRTAEYDYPEIKFRSGSGADKIFTSEIGASARLSRYAVGQKIAVLDDPDGAIAPMIDSWAGIWLPHLIRTLAGPLFIFGALLIYWAFGDRILGL